MQRFRGVEMSDFSLMWYVYGSTLGGDFECIGAFSREEDAKEHLASAQDEWQKTSRGRGAISVGDSFNGVVIRESWSEFCEQVFQCRLGSIADPIKHLAKANGWRDPLSIEHQESQLISK